MFRNVLQRDDLRALVILGALASVAIALCFFPATEWNAPYPRDFTKLVVGRDFLNFWMYGRAAFESDPARYYDPHVYSGVLQSFLGSDYPSQTWSYPPSLMLVAAPFGLLDYRMALVLWTAGGIAALSWWSARTLREDRSGWVLFLSPAAIFCIISGQTSFITLAMLLAAFAFLEKRPLAAGLLIGLLTIKPQIGLLLPVVLIAGRHWRALAAATLSATALVIVTALIFGVEIWRDYFLIGVPAQNIVLSSAQVLSSRLMPTVFMNLHLAGMGYASAMALQVFVALAAAAALFRAFRYHPQADGRLHMALYFACSAAATPYLMPYDGLPLAWSALVLLATRDPGWPCRMFARLAWWLPFLQMALGQWSIPGSGFIAPALAAWLALKIMQTPQTAATTTICVKTV